MPELRHPVGPVPPIWLDQKNHIEFDTQNITFSGRMMVRNQLWFLLSDMRDIARKIWDFEWSDIRPRPIMSQAVITDNQLVANQDLPFRVWAVQESGEYRYHTIVYADGELSVGSDLYDLHAAFEKFEKFLPENQPGHDQGLADT